MAGQENPEHAALQRYSKFERKTVETILVSTPDRGRKGTPTRTPVSADSPLSLGPGATASPSVQRIIDVKKLSSVGSVRKMKH